MFIEIIFISTLKTMAIENSSQRQFYEHNKQELNLESRPTNIYTQIATDITSPKPITIHECQSRLGR